MAFDHVDYVSTQPLPAAQSWMAGFSWLNLVLVDDTEMRVTNKDGSVTVFRGSGFTLNALGEPNAGTVTSVERYNAERSVLLESMEFRLGVDPGDVSISAFVVNGFDTWLTEGDDNYSVAHDVLIHENPGHGTDTVTLLVSPPLFYTMPVNVENVVHTDATNLLVRGNRLSNTIITADGKDTLIGDEGNDYLDGGAGIDVMSGGTGNDTFVVDETGDKVLENAAQGNDTVLTTLATYTLANNVENLGYVGFDIATLKGNALANILSGGAGSDTLAGNLGNDTYLADDTDIIVELSNQGVDLVKTASDFFTLSDNVENLIFYRPDTTVAAVDHTGTGNTLDNRITGDTAIDTLYGLEGRDILSGGIDDQADMLYGGLGNDTYILEGSVEDTIFEEIGEGTDAVSSYLSVYTLPDNVENLHLQGPGGYHEGYGNDLDNIITGTTGIDRLYGGGGKDTLQGGMNDDIYVIDDTIDVIKEIVNQGSDTVETTLASYTVGLNLENIVFTDDADHTGTGNSANNKLYGAGGSDKLTGLAGNDTLDGGLGADTLIGGLGNDTYVVSEDGDVVTEVANQGTDLVKTELAEYTLGNHVENLSFERADPDLTAAISHIGTGNGLSNVLKGDSEADILYGEAGQDTLDGGQVWDDTKNAYVADEMADELYGGAGNDTYIVRDAADVVVEDLNAGTDTVYSYADTFTAGENIENIEVRGSKGDVHIVTGNDLKNRLIGDVSNDVLDGGAGNDFMAGGAGNDTYYVDSKGDLLLELASGGTDSVVTSLSSYTLATSFENLLFSDDGAHTGRGNEIANYLVGGAGLDQLYGLAGNDILDGGLDGVADKLTGGTGNDTYYIYEDIDIISEGASEGTLDTVVSDIDGYVLTSNVEGFIAAIHLGALTATGNASANVMRGNHGTLASGAEIFYGLAGDDILDSGHAYDGNNKKIDDGEADELYGGTGNDTYVVWDSATDLVVEYAGEGIDSIISYEMDAILGENIENLALAGHTSINLVTVTGNELDNKITGDVSHDYIDGGAGNDAMTGGLGNDTYVVDSKGDAVTEDAGDPAGFDTVYTSLAKYTLSANVEYLIGTSDSAQELIGNELSNTITGGLGADTLKGLAGDDTYYVGDGDIVVETGSQGTDLVKTDLASYMLTANVENLEYYVADPDIDDSDFTGTGNAMNNRLTGGAANDRLFGLTGHDRLEGGEGADHLVGGYGNDVLAGDALSSDGTFTHLLPDFVPGNIGNDTFYITAGEGRDEVLDFRGVAMGGGDQISIHSLAEFDDYADVQAAMTQTYAGVRIDIDTSTSILLKGLSISDLDSGDFIFLAP